eukprot:CAMPEP_0194053982 /NCGR_PEP_ID=MMETSP0009_2-20130614/52011_1 /TAXON_ID=210454 /ORGANISM="Grammatophora oceanica, Strain CCMP 410" /LENGTH=208 /DNA_ID=CAMNT_0038702315 /DNA_START=97 /DNA_END=723 /DNA_ORIENTATION=-
MTPLEAVRVQCVGGSSLSAALTSALLLLNEKPWQAAVMGALPRYLILVWLLATGPSVGISTAALVPVYGILTVMFAAMVLPIPFLGPNLAAKIVASVFIIAGVQCLLSPLSIAQQASVAYDEEKQPNDLSILRVQGKADLVNGALLWGLGMGYSSTKSIGAACLAWTLAILVNDIGFQNATTNLGSSMSSVIVELAIALFGSKRLFFS